MYDIAMYHHLAVKWRKEGTMDNTENQNPFLDSEPVKKASRKLHVRDDVERATESTLRDYNATQSFHINEETMKNMHTDSIPENKLMDILNSDDEEDTDDFIKDSDEEE